MNSFSISFKYSKDGKSWTHTSSVVKADSDVAAIAQINSRYPYIKDVRIMSKR